LWIGVIGFILTHFPSAHVRGFRYLFLSGFIAGALSWFVFLALALLPRIKTMGENQFHWISRISAVFLLLLALILIFEKF
ncbi:MAG TPA: hypothetical protein VD913_06190, partial [bacterium]|nr:hypothetical protein [bacterium]